MVKKIKIHYNYILFVKACDYLFLIKFNEMKSSRYNIIFNSNELTFKRLR